MSVIDAEIIIRTEKALAEIRKIPGVTEVEAKKMAATLSREWSNAEKATAKATKRMAEDFRKAFEVANREAEEAADKAAKNAKRIADEAKQASARGAEAIIKKVGGQFGSEVSDVLDLATSAGGAIGAIGVAALGSAAAMTALAVGAKSLADNALEARDRLTEAGLRATMPPEALVSLRDYETATTDLGIAMDGLSVIVGSTVAPALTWAADTASRGIREFRDLADAIEETTTPTSETAVEVKRLWDVMAGLAGGGIPLLIGAQQAERAEQRAFIESTKTMADEFEADLARMYEAAQIPSIDQGDAYAMLGLTEEDEEATARLAEAKTKAAEATRRKAEADRLAAEAARANVAEGQALWATIEKETKALQDLENAKADAAILDMRWADAQREAADASRELAADSAALTLAADEAATKWGSAGFAVQVYAANLDALASSPAAEAVIDGFDNVIALQEQQHEAAVEQMQERMDRGREEIEAWSANESEKVARMLASGQIDGKQAIERRKAIQMEARARREALQDETKAERAALQRSFKAHKKMQQVAAAIDAARAAMALVPAFAFLGPGAPVAAAAVAGTALAVQLGAIGKQKAPEFPMGYAPSSPDHGQSVRIQPGREAVLNERGVANAGGAAGVRELNDGRAAGVPPRVVVQLGRRVVAEVLAAAGGPATPDPRRGKVDPWVSQG